MDRRSNMKWLSVAVTATWLTACLEAQPAPDLPTRTISDFQLETVVDGLERPWAVASLPEGGYLITGKLGKLWRIESGTAREIENLPMEIGAFAGNRVAEGGQGGLLDVALAPDFATSGEIYLSYAYGNWNANGTALLRAYLDGDRIVSSETVFRVSPAKAAGSHFGGKILFLNDGTLLLSLGDGFSLREEAQKPASISAPLSASRAMAARRLIIPISATRPSRNCSASVTAMFRAWH